MKPLWARVAAVLFGFAAYVFAGGSCLLFAAFLANLGPLRIDSPASVRMVNVLADIALIVLFGLQHSVMARSWFKESWIRLVPSVIERSVYVAFSGLALVLLCVLWQPLPGILWNLEDSVWKWPIHLIAVSGLALIVVSSFAISHFDLMGLRQVWRYWRGQPDSPDAFGTPGPYRWVRHPLMLGLLIAFWSAPTVSMGRLLLNVGMSIYCLAAIRWEEQDLVRQFGDAYREYCRRVPMLLPWPRWHTRRVSD